MVAKTKKDKVLSLQECKILCELFVIFIILYSLFLINFTDYYV